MKRLEYLGNKNVIHKQLRKLRISRGMTQSDLAAQMQVMDVTIDQQMISKIENNTRIVTDFELACLCKILEVDENTLLKDFSGSDT